MIIIEYSYYDSNGKKISYLKKIERIEKLKYTSVDLDYYGVAYSGLFKTIGRIIHGAGKAIGSFIHNVGKGLKYALPIVVPIAVGAGLNALLAKVGATAVAKVSAASVAKAVEAGAIGSALTQSVVLAGKVAVTNVVSSAILRSLHATPETEPAVLQTGGGQPALIIPAFVRQLVEPNHLVAYATKNGKIQNSRIIQQRIDWLANTIQQVARELGRINQECQAGLTRDRALQILKQIFWNIPSTQSAIERYLQQKKAELRRKLCCNPLRIRNILIQLFGTARYPTEKPYPYCINKTKNELLFQVKQLAQQLCGKVAPAQLPQKLSEIVRKKIEECVASYCDEETIRDIAFRIYQASSIVVPDKECLYKALQYIQINAGLFKDRLCPLGDKSKITQEIKALMTSYYTTCVSTKQRALMAQKRASEAGVIKLPPYIQIGKYKIPTLYAIGGGILLLLLLTRPRR